MSKGWAGQNRQLYLERSTEDVRAGVEQELAEFLNSDWSIKD